MGTGSPRNSPWPEDFPNGPSTPASSIPRWPWTSTNSSSSTGTDTAFRSPMPSSRWRSRVTWIAWWPLPAVGSSRPHQRHYERCAGARPASLRGRTRAAAGGVGPCAVFRDWKLPAGFHALRAVLEERHGELAGTRHFIQVLQLLNTHPQPRVERAIGECRAAHTLTAEAIIQRVQSLAAAEALQFDARSSSSGTAPRRAWMCPRRTWADSIDCWTRPASGAARGKQHDMLASALRNKTVLEPGFDSTRPGGRGDQKSMM